MLATSVVEATRRQVKCCIMSQTRDARWLKAPGPGFYLLEVERREPGFPVLLLNVQCEGEPARSYYLPALRRTRYLLRVRRGGVQFSVEEKGGISAHFRRIRISDFCLFSSIRRGDRRAGLDINRDVSFIPVLSLSGREGRELMKSISVLKKFGFDMSSPNFQRTPGLFDDLSEGTGFPAPVHDPVFKYPSIAVVLHLHYRELWDEFEFFLRRFGRSFQLIVTTNSREKTFEERVRASFPDAEIYIYENRGRDVGAFLQLLTEGRLSRFDIICKVHGKRSAMMGPRALLGHVWRRANLIDLMGSAEQVEKIVALFLENPHIGMLGSGRFHFPNERWDESAAWGANREYVRGLAERLGISLEKERLNFFAGTMFWVARQPLEVLRTLNISIYDFPDEDETLDGGLNHAIERLFGLLPTAVGMQLADAPIVEYENRHEENES